jgi:tetratricopeptide (TPR) repeat protein
MTMMKKLLIITTVLLAAVTGCGKNASTETPPAETTAAEYLAQGWTSFSSGNYTTARANFDNAIAKDASLADAYNGKGWCQGILGSPAGALAAFTEGLSHSTGNNQIKAGMAFSYSTMDSSVQAISLALQVHASDSLWLFPHTYRVSRDNVLNYKELRLLLCQNYFKRAVFDSSLLWVQKLNPGYAVDVATAAGQAALQAEIERLAGTM